MTVTKLKLASLFLFILLSVSCGSDMSRLGVVVIHAQSLPVTKIVDWDDNPVTDEVTNYTVTLDKVIVGNPTVSQQSVTFTTPGLHTVSVTATNLWATSAAASITRNVVVPGNPSGIVVR